MSCTTTSTSGLRRQGNEALEGTDWDGKPVEEVRQPRLAADDKQAPVRNNGGGHANHWLFWESMSPDGGGEPSGELADAINAASARSTRSRSSSRPTASASSARAGPGSCSTAAR